MSRPLDALDFAEIGRAVRGVELGQVGDFASNGHVTVVDSDGHRHEVALERAPDRDRGEELARQLERYGYRIVRERDLS